ncbi:winged helix-turn-helix transcriptional regulator [Streptomyces bathyalis]|uniref:Winged helix-turn-helix transcriptional regulator n=1 Tax=Streptomyces bathyalis TaxID=2710756 RepID=A0A7T1TDC6_9ACTN|nr:metalloregulator ArsR/SmtB family transcription factor [Streptomyces bathyalis]QPP10891.1 winged helix-turn-helix transcriptional regulator [Streptomyces bathyalis]
MDATWTALADPHRRAMLDVLRERACAVGELVDELGFTQPTTSKHLRVLREAGLVKVRVHAQRRIYSIDLEQMAELDAWLAPFRQLWNERLDALGRHLDRSEPRSGEDERTQERPRDENRGRGR